MPSTHLNRETHRELRRSRNRRRRISILLTLIFILLLLIFIPPLLNISRFQRRIAANISASVGRSVHFDRVALALLPFPGVTLSNFVVDEDPAFGYEPILRAGEVRATLRIAPLFHRRVEFSRISLSPGDTGAAPTLNLVHSADGRWNLSSILLQASRLQAAPTAQKYAGPAPRFPYIEATGARLDLKLTRDGIPEKTPYSLSDADFALWLPEPHQWHLRLEAHPIRTDATPSDAGAIRIEGTLGGADTPAASLDQVPINLQLQWHDAQLGGLSHLLLGRDAGFRGDLTLAAGILGTVGHNALAADIQLANARRSDFVPAHPLSLHAACQASVRNSFRSLSTIECHWPPADSSDPSVLILAAEAPDLRDPSSAYALLTLPALPASTFFDWLGIATPHPPTGFTGQGTVSGTLAWHADRQLPPPLPPHPIPQQTPQPAAQIWTGELEFSGESLQLPALGPDPVPLGDLLLRSTPAAAPPSGHRHAAVPPHPPIPNSFDLLPVDLPLGGKQPATLQGHFDPSGYTLRLTGNAVPARLFALADAVPQFGDGLRKLLEPIAEQLPIHLDLTATRIWGGPQLWTEATPPPSHYPHK
jgi:AsmA protein